MAKETKRKKPDPEFLIRDWIEADMSLRHIGDLSRRIDQVNQILEDKIQELRAQAEEQIAPKAEQVRLMERGLQHFTAGKLEELEEVEDRRSKKLIQGTVGFRRTPPKITGVPRDKVKLAGLLKELRRRRLSACIQVEEKVLKSRLLELSDDRLAVLGLNKSQDDEFFYELFDGSVKDRE